MNPKLSVFLALFAFAAGGTPLAHAVPPAAACSLLTAAQVSAALGVSVEAGKAADKSICEWSQQGAAAFSGKAVLLTIIEPIGNLTPVDRFNAAKIPVPGMVKTPVSGLGDDAVYAGNKFRVTLTVKKGSSVFEIMVSGLPVEESKAKEKTLAQDVLAKL